MPAGLVGPVTGPVGPVTGPVAVAPGVACPSFPNTPGPHYIATRVKPLPIRGSASERVRNCKSVKKQKLKEPESEDEPTPPSSGDEFHPSDSGSEDGM